MSDDTLERMQETRNYVEREKRGEVASDRYSAARLLAAKPWRPTMPDDTLEAIRARLEAATPGPWKVRRGEAGGGAFIIADRDGVAQDVTLGTVWGDAWCVPVEEAEANIQLVAHAPTDIARLLDVAEAARDVLADFDYVNEWGYEEGGKSLDYNLYRLRTALHEMEGGERG